MQRGCAVLIFSISWLCASMVGADQSNREVTSNLKVINEVDSLCQKIAQKLNSVAFEECQGFKFELYKSRSVQKTPLLMKEFKGAAESHVPKVLFIAGIHGDEYSSVSSTFKWLKILEAHHSGKFHWLFLPLSNPDGLLRKAPQRMNANDVDLNRNFPPEGGDEASLAYWKTKAAKDPRRFPGFSPASEPETKAIMEIMAEFKPDVIVSVHAPYDLLDFDGSSHAPEKFGPLNLKLLGTYPGSLGNFAWLKLGIPVVTLELANAGIMPTQTEIDDIWDDLVYWLKHEQPKIKSAQLKTSNAS